MTKDFDDAAKIAEPIYNFSPEEVLDAIHEELESECWWDALTMSETWQKHKSSRKPDDAAIERVARWLFEFDPRRDEYILAFDKSTEKEYYRELSREIADLLTHPEDGEAG